MAAETILLGTTIVGDRRTTVGAIYWPDGLYATGGLPISTRTYGLHQIDMLRFQSFLGYLFSPSPDNTKILVYHGDNNAVADSPLIELPAGTDLSVLGAFGGIYVTWEAWGS
jgi:hypothetical protein